MNDSLTPRLSPRLVLVTPHSNGDTLPRIHGGWASEILAVRAALVSQCCREAPPPLSAAWAQPLEAAWRLLRSSVLLASPVSIAEQEWRLRLVVLGRLAGPSRGLTADLLSQGDRELTERLGARPPTVDAQQRLSLMQQWIHALKADDRPTLLQTALHQIELDNHELKVFAGL
ncbi:hypothetical protein [Roseateles terrae]|uniref:Uncharacterized protein n=1 Tax=Roseateles terrae TaxID=431060 RepID=A0ABR6GXJ9_9BURK|nr:hypothetical protein [Roseateles terrae]MBB3196835.1 hypothetical protein [Roseateles terrae]OWQ84604.1 hypothetical protein CDN98_19090 [Roseateles terrae]